MGRKTDEREWLEQLRKDLPKQPPPETVRFAEGLREINPALMIFARESVPERDFDNFMEAGLWDPPEEKYHWGAKCRCTACGYEFTAGWKGGKAVILTMEDGNTLEGWTDGEDYDAVAYGEGDDIACPDCGETCRMIRRSRIRGRSFITRIAELTNIGRTTVILYWLADRWLDKEGFGGVSVYPERAAAISPGGRVFCFKCDSDISLWTCLSKAKDPEDNLFFCGGGLYDTKYGANYFFNAGDMTGTTGEKTAVDVWFRSEQTYRTVDYLKEWRRHPSVETLVKTGGAGIVMDHIRMKLGYDGMPVPDPINFRERKPHRMLGLTREEYRVAIAEHWALSLVSCYQIYKTIYPKTTAQQFTEWAEFLGSRPVHDFREFFGDGLGKICGYLYRQQENGCPEPDNFYLDYRHALDSIRRESGIVGELTEEEKFPRYLREAHERAVGAQAAILRERRRKGTPEQAGTFAKLKKELRTLEWKRGEYCILIPESPEDLVREGETLGHCVGGYASQHCSGKMIFFVRHARRPERSWFTLNEDVNGSSVKRIQLHGYRNEWVHGKKLIIPQQVLDFVKEWEDTVLAPYLKNRRRISA